MVALPIKQKGLPDSIHPVDLSAMSYIKNRGKPVQSWRDYYITVMGFPKDPRTDAADPLKVSIGRVKGEKGDVLCALGIACDVPIYYLCKIICDLFQDKAITCACMHQEGGLSEPVQLVRLRPHHFLSSLLEFSLGLFLRS